MAVDATFTPTLSRWKDIAFQMQRAAIVVVGVLWLAGCGPATPHARISKETAIKAALAEVQSLERDAQFRAG